MSLDALRLPAGALPTDVRVRAEGGAYDVALEALRREAFEAGRRAGEADAHAGAAAVLEGAVERLDAQRRAAEDALARTAVELAMEITRALVRAEVRAQRHDVEKIVRETLAAAATERGPCVVHLNPDDLARLEGVRFRAGTRLEADSGVRRGDVHVESALGLLVREIDALLASVGERIAGDLA